MSSERAFGALLLLLAAAACDDGRPASVERLARANRAIESGARAAAADTCMRIHELWQDQLRVALQAAEWPSDQRNQAFLDQVYRPHQRFWQGYVGDEDDFIKRVAARWTELETDPRAEVPTRSDVSRLIRETATRASTLAARPPACADWYLVYGPGWTNIGGGAMGMVVDFFGLPREDPVGDLQLYMPHEIGHLVFARSRPAEPDGDTLLRPIIEEGFVSYFSALYHGGIPPARALGYSDQEWEWAVGHERELWQLALPQLHTTDQDLIRRFRAANEHIMRGAPGKIGYFLGYRIVQAYVAAHGPESWRELFDLPLRIILSESRYSP